MAVAEPRLRALVHVLAAKLRHQGEAIGADTFVVSWRVHAAAALRAVVCARKGTFVQVCARHPIACEARVADTRGDRAPLQTGGIVVTLGAVSCGYRAQAQSGVAGADSTRISQSLTYKLLHAHTYVNSHAHKIHKLT